MGASWQAFYAHLCAASIIRAMPETEIPPAMRGDLYSAKPKESWLLGVSLTPQSHFVRLLPVRGAFWCYISSNIMPALKGVVSMSVSELTEGL